jgi:hypothetical protein
VSGEWRGKAKACRTAVPTARADQGEDDRRNLRGRITEDFALWRAEAWAAYSLVGDELHRATARHDATDEALATEAAVVQADLDDALEAIAPPEQSKGSWHSWLPRRISGFWKALKRYYSGGDISKAWSAIHRAGESLFAVYEEPELHAQTTRLEDLVAALPDSKAQGKALADARLKLESGSADEKRTVRAMLRQLYRDAVGTTEALQIEARVLRNTLLVASVALLLVVLAFGIVGLIDPNVFPLCSTASGKQFCPTGASPHPFDTFAVELAGMLGGILSVVIPLAIGERIKTPYRVFNHQLLLKLVAGAGTALAGILLIQSAFSTAIQMTSETMIVGYAIFFGFSQQALTGIIDRRANELGKETPTAKTV